MYWQIDLSTNAALFVKYAQTVLDVTLGAEAVVSREFCNFCDFLPFLQKFLPLTFNVCEGICLQITENFQLANVLSLKFFCSCLQTLFFNLLEGNHGLISCRYFILPTLIRLNLKLYREFCSLILTLLKMHRNFYFSLTVLQLQKFFHARMSFLSQPQKQYV